MISTRRGILTVLFLLQLAGCSSSPATKTDATTMLDELATIQQQNHTTRNPYLMDRQPVANQAQLEFDQAVADMRAKRWSQAVASLTQLVDEYPELSGPWLNLGISYVAIEQPAQADAAFQQAIEVNPKNLNAYNRLAALKRRAGDFSTAEALYLKALSIWPDHANSHLNLGVLYDVYMGKFEQAAIQYQAYQALQDEPNRRVAGWLMDLERRPQMLAI